MSPDCCTDLQAIEAMPCRLAAVPDLTCSKLLGNATSLNCSQASPSCRCRQEQIHPGQLQCRPALAQSVMSPTAELDCTSPLAAAGRRSSYLQIWSAGLL